MGITLPSKLSNPILKNHFFIFDRERDDEQTCGCFSLSEDETHGGGRNNLG